jgi:hypothetical protein
MMQIEEIGEPIDVIGKFQQGKFTPMRLRWQGRVYNVGRITSSWVYTEGEHKEYYYALETDRKDLWEVRLDSRTFSWTLQRVCLE